MTPPEGHRGWLWRPLFAVPSRAAASLPLLATVWLMATVAATLAATIPTYATAVVGASLRADVAGADPKDSGAEVAMRHPAAGWPELVPLVSGLVDPALAAPSRRLVIAETDSYGLPDSIGDGSGVSLVTSIATVDDVATDLLIDIVGTRSSSASSNAIAVSLHTEAAQLLDVEVGDRIELDGRADGPRDVEIVALFEPADRTDPLWRGDGLLRDGVTQSGSFIEVGPLLTDAAAFATLPKTASYRWRWSLRADLIETDTAAATATGLAAASQTLTDALERVDIDVTTGIPAMVAASRSSIGATSVVIGLILLQVAGVALYGLALAAFAVVDARAAETRLIRSRGATAVHLGMLATLEAVLVMVPAVAVAPLLARTLVDALGRWGPAAGTGLDLDPSIGVAGWMAAIAVGLAAVVIVVAPAIRAAGTFKVSSGAPAGPRPDAGDTGFLRRTGLDIGIIAVAGFALWQMVRAGSVATAGTTAADPLLIGAPALGIIGISLIVLRLFAGAAAAVDSTAATRRPLVPALAGWELSRRPGRLGRISVLVILATAVGAFAAVHLTSLRQSHMEQADAQASADLVVTPDPRSRSQIDQLLLAEAYRSLPGLTGAMPVDRQPVSFGFGPTAISSVPLVAIDTSQADALLRTPPRLADPGDGGWAALRRPLDLGGLPLDGSNGGPARLGSGLLEATVRARPVAGDPPAPNATAGLGLVVADGDATLHRLSLPSIALDGTATVFAADLATQLDGAAVSASGPLRLVEIEVRSAPVRVGFDEDPTMVQPPVLRIEIADLRNDGVSIPGDIATWVAGEVTSSPATVTAGTMSAGSDAMTIEFSPGAEPAFGGAPVTIGRLVPATAGVDPPPMPVLMTEALTRDLDLRIGDQIDMTLRGRPYTVELGGTVSAVPFAVTAERAVLADWSTVNTRQYLDTGILTTPTDWALGVEPTAQAATAATLLDDPYRSAGIVDRRVLTGELSRDPTTVGLSGSLVFALVAAVTVAMVGMTLTAVMAARQRRPGVAILRALGIHRGELRQWMLLETLPLVMVSAAAGVATGIGLARLSLRAVAIAADGAPAIPAPLLVIPWPAIGAITAAVIAMGTLLPLATAGLLGRHRPADEIRFGEQR